jgi:mRNA interferase RelE/StbE
MSSDPSSSAANYKLGIKPSAAKELESLGTKKDREKIVSRINTLAKDPRPNGSEKLAGEPNSYRVRQGNYRIVYA